MLSALNGDRGESLPPCPPATRPVAVSLGDGSAADPVGGNMNELLTLKADPRGIPKVGKEIMLQPLIQ